MQSVILGSGPMGRALAAALAEAGHRADVLGRPPDGNHPPSAFAGTDVVFDFSIGRAVAGNVRAALAGGCRRLVIGTTGWNDDHELVDGLLRQAGAAAVVAPTFSPGVTLFLALAEEAARRFGALDGYDPYILEWHRAAKLDRPSGTAGELARRVLAAHPRKQRLADPAREGRLAADGLELVSLRAGESPGMHLLGFDAAGETFELRLTARDRSAYAAGALLAADWLLRQSRPAGMHPFSAVLDELIAAPVPA